MLNVFRAILPLALTGVFASVQAQPERTTPVPIYKPEPQMPTEAVRAHFNGVVQVRATIDDQGNVINPEVVRRVGMGLDEAALDTVRTWKFKPATLNGTPVSSPVTVEISFRTLQDAAAKTGPGWDAYALGLAAARANKPDEAARYYETAAKDGIADAQWALGMAYLRGTGVPPIGSEAAWWLTRAANQGHLAAQQELARMYETDDGVAKDLRTALMWSLIAAKSGGQDRTTETARIEGQLSASDVDTARRMATGFQPRAEASPSRPQGYIGSSRPATVPAGAAGGVYRLGGNIRPPVPTYKPDPEYSEEARRAHIDGSVLLSVVVGPDGNTRDIKVIRPLGYGLDEKAIETVRQWRFQPATKDGEPVAVLVNVEVNFRLLKRNPTAQP